MNLSRLYHGLVNVVGTDNLIIQKSKSISTHFDNKFSKKILAIQYFPLAVYVEHSVQKTFARKLPTWHKKLKWENSL